MIGKQIPLKCNEIRTAFLQVLPTELSGNWMACTTVTYYNWRRMLMPPYTIHASTPCISTMPALVHFLIFFYNCNLSLLTAVPVTLFSKLNAQMHEIQTSLSRVEAKTHNSGTINTKTKMMAHNKVREKIRVRLHDRKTLPRQNLRAIPSGVFITTHTVSEPENANSLARSTLIDLTCSNFTPTNSTSLQQIHLQICTTLTGATIITSMVIVHANAHSHVLTSKTIHRTRNTRTVHIVTLMRYFGFETKFPIAFSLWILVLACRFCLLRQLLFNVLSERTANFAHLVVISCVHTA